MANTYVYSTQSPVMLDYAWFQQASNLAGDTAVLTYSGANMRAPTDFQYSFEGVRSLSDFIVSPGTTAGTVQISSGMAVVTGDSQQGQGKYIISSYGSVDNILAIGTASGTQKNHLVCAEILDKQALSSTSGLANSQWRYSIVEDTTGGTLTTQAQWNAQVATLLPPNALPIALISRPVGQAAVLTTDVHDMRTLAVLSGISSNMVAMATWKGANTSYLAQGITTTEVNCNMYVNNVPCVAGRTYFVEALIAYTISVAAAMPALRLRETNVSGQELSYWFSGTTLVPTSYRQYLRGPYYCTTSGLKTFMVTGFINSGSTGNLTVVRDNTAYVSVYDVGVGSTGIQAF